MLDIHYYTAAVEKLGSTWYGKTLYSICVGALGVVILAIFFAGMLEAAGVEKLLPVIVGFNAALTAFMTVEKTRNMLVRKQALSMGAGIAMVLLATVGLNILSYKWAGYSLVGVGMLMIMLVVGIIAASLGGKLCTKYLALNQASKAR
jgi:hypothetical protein